MVLYAKIRGPTKNLMKSMDLLKKNACMARIFKFLEFLICSEINSIVLLYK